MIRMGLVGLGKMGISHLAIANSHPAVTLAAVCDSSGYSLQVLNKYSAFRTFTEFDAMIAEAALDAVIIATPSRLHVEMARAALDRGLHVFCEKPFCLDHTQGVELARLAHSNRRVNQVGYHCRFVGAFREAKRLVAAGVLGRIHHVRAEVYGPVVTRSRNTTWRGRKGEGGGCLYDYACHAIDLVNYIVGCPDRVGGAVLNKVFSDAVEDEVYCTLYLPDGITGQLACNWTDSSYRKMETKLTIWGSDGHISVDRQEIRLYVRDGPDRHETQHTGWTITNTSELTECPNFYLRGEEYSAQMDHFIHCIETGQVETESSFASASSADKVIEMILDNAKLPTAPVGTWTRNMNEQIEKSQKGVFSRARAIISSALST